MSVTKTAGLIKKRGVGILAAMKPKNPKKSPLKAPRSQTKALTAGKSTTQLSPGNNSTRLGAGDRGSRRLKSTN